MIPFHFASLGGEPERLGGNAEECRGLIQSEPRVDPILAWSEHRDLVTLVRAYCAERDRINADENANDEHFLWLFDRLTHDTPECWTAEGAVESLKLVASNIEHDISDLHGAVLASVMTFAAHRT